MYSLRIGTDYLALPKNVALPYVRNNALFQFEAIAPSHTYPIEIPNTPAVRKVFGAVHDPSLNIDLSIEYDDAALCIDGNDAIAGVVEILPSTSKMVKLAFRFGVSYLATKSKAIKLSTLFEGDTIAMTIENGNYMLVNYNIANHNGFYFKYNGVTVFAAADPVPGTIMTTLRDTIIAQWPTVFEIWTGPSIVGGSSWLRLGKKASPTLAPLAYSYLHVDNGEGGTVDEWPWTESEVPEVLEGAISTFTSADLGVKYELPTIHAPSFYNYENESYLGFLNVYRDNAYVIPRIKGMTSFESTLLPCMRYDWILQQVFEKLGVELAGDFLDNAELMAKHFIGTRPIDQELQLEDLDVATVLEIPIDELLPDMTVREFIASNRVEHGLDFSFDLAINKLSMNFAKDVMDTPDSETLEGKVIGIGPLSQEKYEGLQIGYALDESDLQIKSFVVDLEDIKDDFGPAADIATMEGYNAIYGQMTFVNSKNAWYKKNGIAADAWEFFGFNMDHYRDDNELKQLRSAFTPLIDLDVLEFEFAIKQSKITAISVAVGFTTLAFRFELWNENGGAPYKVTSFTTDADGNKQASYVYGDDLYALFSLTTTQVEYYIDVIEIVDDVDQAAVEQLRKTVNARVIRVPSMELVGYLPAFDLSNFDKTPRFSVYRGFQDGSSGSYPMSSLGRYKQDETLIAGANINFTWNKIANNLMDTFYPNYQTWLQFTKDYSMSVVMSKIEFEAMDLKKKFNHRGATFLIESLQGNLANEAKIELHLKVKTV
jgi:hypothetical protein